MSTGSSILATAQGRKRMKKTITILMAAAVSLAASGIISAAGFENDLGAIRENLLAAPAGPLAGLAEPQPALCQQPAPKGSRWWSVNFFGSGHKASAKAALKAIDKSYFHDLGAASDILKSGVNDESGHLNKDMNGGPVKEIWFGLTPFSKGGVIANYTQFKFDEAYERLGTICHLTQDQAVPTHAANIHHGINDSFEGFYGNDVKITARRTDTDREPYEYYQVMQDETRRKLPGWTDPETGLPYWVPAPDAPRLGQDATYGPWGHYGGKRGWDVYAVPPPNNNNFGHGGANNGPWTSAHPEIRQQQLNASGEVTISVLESASKRLPPLVRDLSISSVAVSGAKPSYSVKFNLYENRAPKVTYTMSVYGPDGALLGKAIEGAASLFPPKDGEIMFSGAITAAWAGVVDFQRLPPGTYTVDLRAKDEDGNVTPDVVNEDPMPDNDTRKTVVIE